VGAPSSTRQSVPLVSATAAESQLPYVVPTRIYAKNKQMYVLCNRWLCTHLSIPSPLAGMPCLLLALLLDAGLD
jgi:hypothetical protein